MKGRIGGNNIYIYTIFVSRRIMTTKNIRLRIFLFVFTCLWLSMVITGCGDTDSDVNLKEDVTEATKVTSTKIGSEESDEETESDSGFIEVSDVSFDKSVLSLAKAPAVNQTVNISYSLEALSQEYLSVNNVWFKFERYDPSLYYPLGRGNSIEDALKYLKANAEFPDPYYYFIEALFKKQPNSLVPVESVLVDGNIKWEGSQSDKTNKIELSGLIRFSEAGEWLITVQSQENGKFPVSRETIPLTINEDSGKRGWEYTYQPSEGQNVLGDGQIFSVDLAITKAMPLDEETEFICTIWSIEDIKDVTAKFIFSLMEKGGWQREKVPAQNIITKGNALWQGDLKASTPVQFPITVKFPETGDWEIVLYGTSPNSEYDSYSEIYIHVGKEKGICGWVESHIKKQNDPVFPYKG